VDFDSGRTKYTAALSRRADNFLAQCIYIL